MKQSLKKILLVLLTLTAAVQVHAQSDSVWANLFDPGKLKPVDSVLKIEIGSKVPDFTLPSLSGKPISLSSFFGKKNVVLSFVPAAWTPVCSDQWPGYNLVQELFAKHDTVLLGITVDNLPTLFAWTKQMGDLWFDVLSDFWPHGQVADMFGVLRSDGVSERALFVIDKTGILRYAHVTDINKRPDLGILIKELEKINPASSSSENR